MRAGSILTGAVTLLLCVSSAWAASPPRPGSTSVDFWGQPDRSEETAYRPLGTRMALFRSGTPVRLLAPGGLSRPLSVVAAHMRGTPGTLVLAKARSVTTPVGPIYIVPTSRGWLCVQGPTFQTCHRGLLRQGLTWNFYSAGDGLDVIGIAANDVRSITLTWSGSSRRARLAHNVFYVHRPITVTSVAHLPPLGRLTVAYRGRRAPASVPLH